MASAEQDPFLDPSITALSHDIKTQPDFHESRWAKFVEANPGRADFLVGRARFLFSGDSEVVRKVLTLMVENWALDEHHAFATYFGQVMQMPDIYKQLEQVGAEEQLSPLPQAIPAAENGTDLAA